MPLRNRYVVCRNHVVVGKRQKTCVFQVSRLSFQELHPGDLKKAVVGYLNKLLDPVRKDFETPEMKKLVNLAYPAVSKSKFRQHRMQSLHIYCAQKLLNFLLGCLQCFVFVLPSPEAQKGKGGAQAAAAAADDTITPARLDLRIGKIISVEKVSLWRHSRTFCIASWQISGKLIVTVISCFSTQTQSHSTWKKWTSGKKHQEQS